MSIYIASRKSNRNIIHTPECFINQRIGEENKVYFQSIQDAWKENYHICRYCIKNIGKDMKSQKIQMMHKKSSVLPKHYVVVDLEMNEVSAENRKKCGKAWMEIIQIGAVLLDSNYQEIGHFNTLVKPQLNNVIGPRYVQLTKITTEMVKEAPVFSQALKMFLTWCQSIPNEIEILQWSPSDLQQIENEMELKKYKPSEAEKEYLQNWSDLQQEFGQRIKRKENISLKNAIHYTGIEKVGRQHNALDDARNTGTILMVLRDPKMSDTFEKKVASLFKPRHFGTSLGSLLENCNVFAS